MTTITATSARRSSSSPRPYSNPRLLQSCRANCKTYERKRKQKAFSCPFPTTILQPHGRLPVPDSDSLAKIVFCQERLTEAPKSTKS